MFLLTMRGRMNFKNIRNEQPPMGQDVLLYSEELEYPFNVGKRVPKSEIKGKSNSYIHLDDEDWVWVVITKENDGKNNDVLLYSEYEYWVELNEPNIYDYE